MSRFHKPVKVSDLLQEYKKLEQAKDAERKLQEQMRPLPRPADRPCPTCGRCPECGAR